MPSTRNNRMAVPASLRRIRTAFTNSHIPSAPLSPVSESSNGYTASRSSTGSRFSQLVSSMSSYSIGKNSIRRSPSQMELEQEEERSSCPDELLCLIEPRPNAFAAVGSFEEVLFGCRI